MALKGETRNTLITTFCLLFAFLFVPLGIAASMHLGPPSWGYAVCTTFSPEAPCEQFKTAQ